MYSTILLRANYLQIRPYISTRASPPSRTRLHRRLGELVRLIHAEPAEALDKAIRVIRISADLTAPLENCYALFCCIEASRVMGRNNQRTEYERSIDKIASSCCNRIERHRLCSLRMVQDEPLGPDRFTFVPHRIIIDYPELESSHHAQILLALGVHYCQLGRLDKSVSALLCALQLWHESGNTSAYSVGLITTGHVYMQMMDFCKARHYFREGLRVSRAVGNKFGLYLARRRFGDLLLIQGQPHAALNNFLKAQRYLDLRRYRTLHSNLMCRIGEAYGMMNDMDKAISIQNDALDIARNEGEPSLYNSILLAMGRTFFRNGCPEMTIQMFECLLNVSGDQPVTLSMKMNMHEMASEAYSATGRHKEALLQHREYCRIRESLFSLQNFRSIAQSETHDAERQIRKHSLRLNRAIRDNGGINDTVAPVQVSQHRDNGLKISDHVSSLTPTELRVCLLIRSGMSTKDIASALFIAESTIGTHRKHIRKKLCLPSRVNLTTYLKRLNIQEYPSERDI